LVEILDAKAQLNGDATEVETGNLTQRREERSPESFRGTERQRRQNHLWQNHGAEIVFCVAQEILLALGDF